MAAKKQNSPSYGCLIVVVIAIFIAIASCVRMFGGGASGDGVLSAPTESAGETSPPVEPIVYTVISVTARKLHGQNCLVADLKIDDRGSSAIVAGSGYAFPDPFRIENSKGRALRYTNDVLTFGSEIPAMGHAIGSMRFCGAEIKAGGKFVLHHEKRVWRTTVPKDKPAPKKKRKPVAPRTPEGGSGGGGGGGGAGPGYTGPRCYAPGGKTWKPC